MFSQATYIKTEPEVTVLGRSLVYKANNVGPSTDPWGIPQVTFSTVECWPFTPRIEFDQLGSLSAMIEDNLELQIENSTYAVG